MNPSGIVSEPADSIPSTSGVGTGTQPGSSGLSPGTPDSVSTGAHAFEAPDPCLAFHTGSGDPVAPGHARQAPGTTMTPSGKPGLERAPPESAGTATGPRSDLYKAPVPFQGRSLGGAPAGDDPRELARSLDVEIPLEDLLPIEPGTNPMVVSDPVVDVRDDAEALAERRAAYARNIGPRPVRSGVGGVTGGPEGEAANARWVALASANRTAPITFGDDPHRIPTLVERETASSPGQGGNIADPYRGAEPPNTLDRSHGARYVPEPQGREPDCETGFGRFPAGWNEHPFSCRERVLNALTRGESLRVGASVVSEPGGEDRCTECGMLHSSQYRAMVQMISDPGDACRHARWRFQGSPGRRLLQLVEMLDHAVVVA